MGRAWLLVLSALAGSRTAFGGRCVCFSETHNQYCSIKVCASGCNHYGCAQGSCRRFPDQCDSGQDCAKWNEGYKTSDCRCHTKPEESLCSLPRMPTEDLDSPLKLNDTEKIAEGEQAVVSWPQVAIQEAVDESKEPPQVPSKSSMVPMTEQSNKIEANNTMVQYQYCDWSKCNGPARPRCCIQYSYFSNHIYENYLQYYLQFGPVAVLVSWYCDARKSSYCGGHFITVMGCFQRNSMVSYYVHDVGNNRGNYHVVGNYNQLLTYVPPSMRQISGRWTGTLYKTSALGDASAAILNETVIVV